ncbi:MAG: hypothetical protein AAGG48_28490 [Planctomycetota bacterium]
MSDDPTVRFVAWQVFFLRDDNTAGGFPASKRQWDYFQRLILLLESNSTLKQWEQRRWSLTQPVAVVALVTFLIGVMCFGYVSLLAYPILGFIAILLTQFRNPSELHVPFSEIVYPFDSLQDLAIAYDSTPQFRKTKFPHQSPERVEPNLYLRYWPWMLFAPFVLLIQCGSVSMQKTTVSPG